MLSTGPPGFRGSVTVHGCHVRKWLTPIQYAVRRCHDRNAGTWLCRILPDVGVPLLIYYYGTPLPVPSVFSFYVLS